MTPKAPLNGFDHLRFELDLETHQAGPRFWMLLGEIRSKCDHIKFVPLGEEAARQLNLVYFAKGVNATTAIEGNTLSQEEVLKRIEGQLTLPISKAYLGVEIDNMVAAYNSIIGAVALAQPLPPITIETLCDLNKQILSGLEVDKEVVPGELRHHNVSVGTYLAPPAEYVPQLLEKLIAWLDTITPPSEEDRIPYAFMKAATAHVYIEWIHPFGDGNGRLGRLVEFLMLVSCGVPLPAAHILTSHYNDTRTEYYRQLTAATKSAGDLRGFFHYAAQGFVDGLVSAIKMLHTQQERLMWRALVDAKFADIHTHAGHRARDLAIELINHDDSDWLQRTRLRSLTPAMAAAYAGTTSKTLSRDITRLREMGLIYSLDKDKWVRPNLSLVRGLRPQVAKEADEPETF